MHFDPCNQNVDSPNIPNVVIVLIRPQIQTIISPSLWAWFLSPGSQSINKNFLRRILFQFIFSCSSDENFHKAKIPESVISFDSSRDANYRFLKLAAFFSLIKKLSERPLVLEKVSLQKVWFFFLCFAFLTVRKSQPTAELFDVVTLSHLVVSHQHWLHFLLQSVILNFSFLGELFVFGFFDFLPVVRVVNGRKTKMLPKLKNDFFQTLTSP